MQIQSCQGIALATELPMHCQELLAAFTDYDFVIGPCYVKYEKYATFYRKQREKARFIVLDNGAFEGELMCARDLARICFELKPDEVVAPDIISDRKGTLEATREFLAVLKEVYGSWPLPLIQASPQGSSFDDWILCYRRFALNSAVNVFGISYVGHFSDGLSGDYKKQFGEVSSEEARRLMFFHRIVSDGIVCADKPHHLLGLYSPSSLVWYSRYPFIRSIDTSFPIVTALCGVPFCKYTSKILTKLDYASIMTGYGLRLAVNNIQVMKGMLER